MLDHEDDLDADFLAIYGIDLETDQISARRFISRADRLPAYQGALAARITAEQQQDPASAAPDAPQEVSVDAVNLMIPGLIEQVEV